LPSIRLPYFNIVVNHFSELDEYNYCKYTKVGLINQQAAMPWAVLWYQTIPKDRIKIGVDVTVGKTDWD
jgi:hypothetical protein